MTAPVTIQLDFAKVAQEVLTNFGFTNVDVHICKIGNEESEHFGFYEGCLQGEHSSLESVVFCRPIFTEAQAPMVLFQTVLAMVEVVNHNISSAMLSPVRSQLVLSNGENIQSVLTLLEEGFTESLPADFTHPIVTYEGISTEDTELSPEMETFYFGAMMEGSLRETFIKVNPKEVYLEGIDPAIVWKQIGSKVAKSIETLEN